VTLGLVPIAHSCAKMHSTLDCGNFSSDKPANGTFLPRPATRGPVGGTPPKPPVTEIRKPEPSRQNTGETNRKPQTAVRAVWIGPAAAGDAGVASIADPRAAPHVTGVLTLIIKQRCPFPHIAAHILRPTGGGAAGKRSHSRCPVNARLGRVNDTIFPFIPPSPGTAVGMPGGPFPLLFRGQAIESAAGFR